MNQPDDIEDLLGRVWCDRYQLLEYVGRGGMGAVFKARQVQMGREVALKVIHRRLCQDEKQIQRFEQEARTSSKLNHPAASVENLSHQMATYVRTYVRRIMMMMMMMVTYVRTIMVMMICTRRHLGQAVVADARSAL